MRRNPTTNQAAVTQTFAGLTECYVSPGGEVILPAEYLSAFDGNVVAMPAVFGTALWLYPYPAWKAVFDAFHEVGERLPQEIRYGVIMRTIGHCMPIPIEKRKPRQGRFTVPVQARLFTGRALLEGCGHFLALHPFTLTKGNEMSQSIFVGPDSLRRLAYEPPAVPARFAR